MGQSKKKPHANARHDVKAEQKIIEAAARQFAARGFAGASIRDIALDAGVSHQLIAYHYGGKEDLWKAVTENEIDRLLETYRATQSAFSELSPTERFRGYVRAFVEFEAKGSYLARLMMQEALARSSRYTKLLNHPKLAGADPVTQFLDEAHESGILIDLPANELKLNFLGLLTHRFMIDLYASNVLEQSVRSDAAIEKHAAIISNMFLRESRG